MIKQLLFFLITLVTSNGSFKNANQVDKRDIGPGGRSILFSFRDSAEGKNKMSEPSMQEQHQHSGPCLVSPP